MDILTSTQRIVLTGPESSGKSALTTYLAHVLGVPCAMEYARIHLERHGPHYDYPLLLTMGKQHLVYQKEQVPLDAPLGVFDTDLINYKVWCDIVYKQFHPELLRELENERNHLYLLCHPDLPWEADPLREHPHERMMLFDRHRAEIERVGRRYEIVSGLGTARFRAAETAARRLLNDA